MKDSIGSYLISKLRGREHLNISKPHLGKTTHLGKEGSQASEWIGGVLVREHHGASQTVFNRITNMAASISKDAPNFKCGLGLLFGDAQAWIWYMVMTPVQDAYKYIHLCISVTIWWPNMKKRDIRLRQRRLYLKAVNFWKKWKVKVRGWFGAWKKTPIFHGKQKNQPIGGSRCREPGHDAQKQIVGSFGQDPSSHRGTVVSCDLEYVGLGKNGWKKSMESAMTIGERDIPDGLVFLLFFDLKHYTWVLLYNRALACPLEWAWGAKANDATCWDSFLHGSRDDQCGYLWPESRCLDGRVQCQIESDQKFGTIIDVMRSSCIIFQPPVVLLARL